MNTSGAAGEKLPGCLNNDSAGESQLRPASSSETTQLVEVITVLAGTPGMVLFRQLLLTKLNTIGGKTCTAAAAAATAWSWRQQIKLQPTAGIHKGKDPGCCCSHGPATWPSHMAQSHGPVTWPSHMAQSHGPVTCTDPTNPNIDAYQQHTSIILQAGTQ